jgi:hypothetical protein
VSDTREPWWLAVEQVSPVPQPVVSSLHATSVPELHVPWRRYRIVSNAVAVPLHVSIVAWPEVVGVHWNVRSGAVVLAPQLPDAVLAPLVAPANVPPAAGITVTPPQPPGSVVGGTVVVLEVVVAVVLTAVLVVGTAVELVALVLVLVLVVEVAVDVLVVEVVVVVRDVLVVDVMLVDVVVVVGGLGGTIRRPNAPLLPL